MLVGVGVLIARRLFPRHRISWAVPIVLGVTIVVVRGLAFALSDGAR